MLSGLQHLLDQGRMNKEAQMIRNWSETAFHRVNKVSHNSTSNKIEPFFKGSLENFSLSSPCCC